MVLLLLDLGFLLCWSCGLIIFYRMPKNTSITHFGKTVLKIYVICSVALVLHVVIVAGMKWGALPDTSFSLQLLQIWLGTGAGVVILWHFFMAGGYLVFVLPLIRLTRNIENTGALFEKKWNSWQASNSRFRKVCLILSMVLFALPGLVAIAMILWAYFEVHALP